MHAEFLLAVVCCLGQAARPDTQSEPAADSVEVRCARAQLKLAETNLKHVKQRNKRVARTVPESVVADYQREVAVAKKRLEQATLGAAGGDFAVWLERAEAERSATDKALKNALAVNKRVPGTYDPLDIEAIQLSAEVAKLQLERGQSLADSDHDAQTRWKLDLLDNQVQRLKEESNRSSPLIQSYPIWRRY